MTDPTNAQPEDTSAPGMSPAPPLGDWGEQYAAPAPAPTPSYGAPAPSYGAPAAPQPYGAPAAPPAPQPYAPYGGAQPVQTSPGAPPYVPYGAYPTRKTNGLAIAALVASIAGVIWLLPFVGSLAGAIMGHVSLNQIKRSGEGGRGMALAGVIVDWSGLVILAGFVLLIVIAALSSNANSHYS